MTQKAIACTTSFIVKAKEIVIKVVSAAASQVEIRVLPNIVSEVVLFHFWCGKIKLDLTAPIPSELQEEKNVVDVVLAQKA